MQKVLPKTNKRIKTIDQQKKQKQVAPKEPHDSVTPENKRKGAWEMSASDALQINFLDSEL